MIYFVADAWSIAWAQSNNARAQKWLVIEHYRVGVSTLSTLRGARKKKKKTPLQQWRF